MNQEAIKGYLNQINYKTYRTELARALERNPSALPALAGMYEQSRLGKAFPSAAENIAYTLIGTLTPCWLLLRKWLVAPFKFPKKKQELRLSTADDFNGRDKTIDILIMLGAVYPSLYESARRILDNLDGKKASVAALLFPGVGEAKKKDLDLLQDPCLVSLPDEMLRSSAGELFGAVAKARRQYQEVAEDVKNEHIRALFHVNRRLLRLLFMFDNFYETTYRRLFARMKPRVIVDNWFNGALYKVAREMNIYTVMIQHGTQWGEDKPSITPDENELLIWGEFWRENFRNLVLPTTKITSLGCPRFDPLMAFRLMPRDDRFYAALGLKAEKQTVTFLSQSHGFLFPEATKQAYIKVVEGLRALTAARKTEINFIIKLHPHDDQAYYNALMDEETRRSIVFLKSEVPLYDILRHTDVAISVTSTALLEALAMDVSIIQFACTGLPDWIDLCSSGGGFLVNSDEELIGILDDLRTREEARAETRRKRQAFIDHCLVNLGTATDKTADYLLRVAKELKAGAN